MFECVGQRGGHVSIPAIPVIHRAAFQFDGLVSLPLKVFEDSPSADGPYGELLEETLVGLK
jgi:hypothetical protein